MSESTRIIINAGGRIFEGLLGSTGETMKGKKRARVSADAGDDAPAELFLDRDPDIFADVLKYMRANRLPAAVRADAHRLDDLKSEAEFFAYDRLVAACDEAQAALPHARSVTLHVTKGPRKIVWGDVVSIPVPAGQVLCISHVLADFDGGYGQPGVKPSMRAAISASNGSKHMIIAQYIMYPNQMDASAGSLRKNMVMEGDENEEVRLIAIGSSWSVHAWVGHPSKIPGLSSKI